MRQFNMNKGNFEVKSHYKMYKAGKRWVVAGMATLSLLGGLMMVPGDASADGVDSSVAPVADSQAPAETTNNATTNSVVLSASATPAPASSVSAEVSATSESSVVSSVVVSSSVASSVVTESVSSTSSVSVAVSSDASSVVSQSLASSVVVPADAVTVKDTESEKAYALGTTPDAETTPDSAVTAVDNGISTYSATPKNATWSVKSNSLVASSHIVTSNAQAKSEVTYSGSGQVTPNFKQTGDITGSITMNSSYVDGKYITNQSDLSSAIVVANDLAHSFNPIATPSNISKSDIDWQAIVPQATNEGGTLAYGTKVDTTKAFEVRGGYKVVPIVNGKLGDITNTETTGNKTNQGGGKYGGGQAVGMIMTPTAVEDMGTLKMGTNLKTLNLSDGIEGVSNALIAGRDLYYGRTGDVNPLLVHLRQTNANGALYAETKTTVNGGNGAKDILGQTVKTDGTTVGYAKASDAKNGVDGSSLGITDYVTNANGSNKTTLFTNYLSQGVYFDYIWTPKSVDGKLQTIEIADANGVKHTYIYADLTYSEYSNFAAISGTPSQADKDKYLLSSVTGTVLVQTQMALGLFGGNGGNGQSFFGGISYFQAKNVLNDVSINYQFKNDPTSLVNSNTVTALAGETVQINGGKDSVAETDGHYVSSYDAPEIKGLKVDSSKKLQAVAGTDTNLTVIYTVDQGAFDAQVTTAQTAKENVQKSIDKATAALATAKTQQDKDDITQAITQLTKISNQIDGIISGLKTATDAGTIAKLDTVDAVTSTLMKLENTAANATDLATSAADLATAVSSFSDKNTSNSATPEDVAHTRAVLEGQNASNLVTDDMGTIVQEAKKALDAAVADKTATTEDIVHKRSVLLADMAADAVAHTDDEEVQRRLVTVADAVKNGTTSEIDEAAAKLKIADSTVVSTDIADDEALNAAKNAVDNALDANPYVQTDADTAKANFDDAVTNATTKLAKAKSDADTVVAAVKNSENDDVKKRVDDVQAIEKSGTKTEIDQAVAKLKVADETVVAVNLSDDDNVKLAKQAVDDALNAKTYDQSAIDKAQSHFNEVVSDANSKLATAKTTANDAVASWTADAHKYADQDTTSIADDVAELNQLTSKDNVTATKQAIDDARQKLADDIAIVEQKRQSAVDDGNNEVDKAQPNVDLDEEVKLTVDGLKQAIADGTQTKIEEAIKKVQTAVDTMVEAKVSDSESVTAAKKVVNDVLNAADLNTDTLNKALGDLDEAVSNAKSALDTAKGNATVEEPTNLIDQIKQLAPADQDTLSTAVAKLKDLVDSKNDSTTTLTEVNEQQTIIDGILNSLKDNRKNAIGTAKKTVTADVPTNIADQADQSTLQADKDNLQKVAADDKSTLDDIQKAQQKVDGDIADMTKNVTEAKTAGKQDVAAWTDPKNVAKYTDQDTKDINDDIAALNDLTAADNTAATQKAITDARQKLADDIAIVEQKRQAAVDDGNKEIDKAQPNVNLDDEVKLTVDGLKQAIADGTQTKIEEAIKKVQTAVDTMVATNVSDSDAVNTAKQAVNDALNATDLNTDTLNKALGDLDKAVSDAKAALATAKGNATVEEPANLLDQIKKLSPADQDKLATAVAKLKDLTDPKNDGTTKASDIKAQQDIVDGILAPLQEARKTAVQDATTVATADVPANITDQAKNSTLQADKDDLQKIAADDKSTLADIQKAQQKVADDIKAMTDNVNDAKSAGNSVINKWNTADNVAKYTDQDETIKDDIATLTGLTSADNKTATQSDIDGARQKLQHDIEVAEGQRQTSVTTADTAVTAVTHATDDDVKARIDAVKSAEETGTKTAIDEAVAKLQVADETVVAKNIADDKDVAGAKQAVDAALDANPYDQAKVDTAKNNYDDAIKQAESKLDAAKKQATVEEPANLLDQIGKLPKDDQAKLATAVANLKNLTDPKNNATTKVSDIKAQQDIVDGILKALQETRQNAIDTANTTVTATVPTNIADQAEKSTLQADKDNLQKVAADDKSTLADIQKAQQKVEDDIADMTKNVTEAKTAGKQDVAAWTDPKNVAKYTDQDTKAINDDIAALNDLTAADNAAATQKAINDARQKLADDIAIVEQKRQAAVDDGNKEIDKAQPNVNLDDEVKLTVDGLKQAIADGTQTKIEEAIKKVQTAVDTMVATNVSDSDAVNTAKQAVNDALNATDLNTDTLNKALGDLDKAVSGAKDALATAKGKATVAEPANLDDQIKKLSPADQDKLATAVANLKNLTDPKNDGTTKASDIKAQQDIVDGILKPLQKNREEAVTEANGIATADVQTNITDQADAAGATLKDDKAALQTAAADDSKTLADIKKAQQKVTDDITAMTKNVTDAKNAGNKVVTTWSDDANVAKYVDQDTTTVDADIKHLQELTSSDEATQTAIDDARKQLESDIKTVTQARQTVVDAADKVITTVNNGDNAANQDVKNRIQAVKDAESAKGTAAIDEAVSKLQNANDTVVPANVADVDGVTTAKQAVDDALNATSYDPTTAAQKVADYKKAVATAKDALKQVTDAVAAIKVPANLQDQVAMDKKNKLGDLTQQVTDLQNLATQADTTASALQPNLTDVQNRLADMTKKLHDMQADGAKLVDQFANATDDNVVKARKQLSTLLASDDATMTDIQNAMNVLKATSAPANNKPVEKQEVPVTNGQVSVPVANGDGAFVIVTDANGKQKVVQLDTADGKASANVSGAKNAQVVTVPKHGDKPFIFVTDGSGTAQYTELTPDGAKTTITPDGSKTETSTGSTIDVPAGSDVSVIYLPTADISVQAGAKNIDVPVKTGYTATVTDANGNVIEMTDGSTINVEGVPAGTNYLVTYTPDPAKVVVKLGTESGFKQGEAPATGNKNAQKLTTVADALAKLQQDEKVEAAIVSTGYTDTKVNVSNALAEMNKVDENLDIDGYAHRVVAPDGKEYASLEDAVKANPTFAAGTTQMKVIYAPLDGQKIQVKDVSGKVLGTVTGKSDAEINVNDFAPIDAVLKQTAKKDNLKITVTAPDGTTYDSLSAALAATGYFDHIGLQNGASSFDLDGSGVAPTPVFDEAGNVIGYQAVLAEAASLNDMNIQDFVVSYTPAIDDTAVSVDGNHYYNNTSNKEMSDNDVDNTVNNLHNMLENGAKSGVANAINKVKTAVNQSVAINVADSGDVQKAKQVINDILNGDNVDTGKLKQAISNLATAVAQAKQALADTKASADADGKNWQTVSPKYADQNTSAIQNDLKKLHDLTSADNTTATKTDIEQARKQLQDDIKKVDDVRQASVKTADGAVATVKNGTNDDVKNRIAAVKAAEETGTKSVIDEAVAKLQTADATVVPTNVSDDAAVIAAKRAVDDALNAKTYVPGDVAKAKQAYDQAVADAQATLRTVIDQANAIKVPANLQNNAGDLIQMVTDLQGMANRADTTVSALRTALTAVQNRLAELNAMNQGGVIDGRQGESIVNTNVATPKEPGVAMAERHESRAAATVVKANKTSVAKGAVMAKPVQAVATTTTAKQAATRGNKTASTLNNGASVAKADKQVVATTTNTPKTDADRIHDMLDDAKVNKASINMTENASENYIGIIIASLMVAGMFGLLAAFWRRQKESEKEFQARINGDK
ncbi:KxYKxGKxW signal peptide domain-containing protein [Weissella cibaria]|uniref:KxYKxGKxW signal peptide domain-containing protein n=2 Tax=Weissella cibaria TaxID=137591 RepID=UPI00376F1104